MKLEHRPLELLIFLVERRGQLVAREEIIERLWGPDVFVDVEAGINTAMRKARKALGDTADSPEYLETVVGKGYRFKGAVAVQAAGSYSSVAVLPVEVLAAEPESQYLADGITEELIAALGQVLPEEFRVVGRTTMMQYGRREKALAAIAAETGARYLVESSLRCEGDTIRLVSRLIAAGDQTQLWGGTFDGERRKSILECQGQLSQAIARQVQAQVSPARAASFGKRQAANPAAYDVYLRGRYWWNQLSAETTRQAMEHFERATMLEADYALPWAGLAVCFAAAPITGDASPLKMMGPARHAAERAQRGGGADLAEAHTAVGFVQFWLEWDLLGAEESFRRAIQVDASDSLAHRTVGVVLGYQGRAEEAGAAARVACELDPLNAANFALASQVAFFARDFSRALALARKAVQIDPSMWVGYLQFAQAAERAELNEEALEALERAAPFCGNNSKVTALRGYVLARTGREEGARVLLRELGERRTQRFVPPYAEALIYMGLGEWDRAMEHLEKGIEVHDVHLSFLPVDAKWDPLRSRLGFQDLVARCGFRMTRA